MDRFLLNKKQVGSSNDSEEASTSGGREAKKRKYRKYDDSYLDFGFTSIEVNNEEKPQCVLCLKILSSESMLPSKLKRHLETIHPTMVAKSRDFFHRKLQNLKKTKNVFTQQASVPNNALLASFKVAYRVAKCKKPHTIAEELILPAAIDMVNIMVGESAGKLISKVPLSNNTISRRIHDIADDLNYQLIEKMKSKDFGLQLDEATDSNSDAHLICYVRFLADNIIVEDLLFCKSITESAKAEDLFEILDKFIAESGLDWEKCIGVCTDGARSMSGRYGGVQALIRKKAPNAMWTHCIIHREALASKSMSSELNQVLECVIGAVNYIKTRPVKARLFKKLCIDMGAEHTALLYYCNSRWLSRGNVLFRVFELHEEIRIFLQQERHENAKYFTEADFLLKLAYLCDIFEKLNNLNLSLQGNNTHILKLLERIAAFRKKLQLWIKKMNEGSGQDCFPQLYKYAASNELVVSQDLMVLFAGHLSKLTEWFSKYFGHDDVEKFAWIRDPFHAQAPPGFTSQDEESLIELSCDSSLKTRFTSSDLVEFWLSIQNEYPNLSSKAL
ncbi:zinc finger BED domain-containing protein 5-like [Harmonia axyridis]|uniref:zinc finger BED domain-containing protein 5-like n=1 Tax=Harmonia axyridis TaxID=115357 RepID=UPI001E277E90|nr:zinc finger BED domain-containing protein 5-like [Harmonia axyridis]